MTMNAAGRLIRIIEAAKQTTTPNSIVGWAQVLGVSLDLASQSSPIDETEVMRGLIQVNELIADIEREVSSLEDIDHELHLSSLPNVRNVFRPASLLHPPQNSTSNISQGDMTVLAFCRAALSKRRPEPTVDEEELSEILADVTSLYEEVLSSSLNADLKKLLLDQLELIRRAIHEYRIRGFERLREVLPTLVGGYVMTTDKDDREEVKAYRKVLSRFASLVTFAADTTQVLTAGAPYLAGLLGGG